MAEINNMTPKRLAFAASGLLTLFSLFVFVLLSKIVAQQIAWEVIVPAHVILFACSVLLYRYFLDRFIYQKIKLIYKSIHDMKVPKEQKKRKMELKGDIINQTQEQVTKWAKDKTKEINELKKLEAYRREFLGNVSHELKTPVFHIQGYVLTLLDGGLDDPQINRKYLQRCEQSIDRMISIIEDLESISKLESGELKLLFSHFDIVELVGEVMELTEISAQKKGIKVYFAQEYDPVFVHADRHLIQQVLVNLVMNSIKHGAENGTTKISFFDMADNVLIEVTDSGAGIPREDFPRIFERFYRGDKSRSRSDDEGGSGLGLAIVKHILEAHAQSINVRSTIGVGSTFAFTLRKGGRPHHSSGQ